MESSMSQVCSQSLQSSIQSLQTSMGLMESSLNILDAGVGDFPRMKKVLQTTKHFELVTEASLKEAQQNLLGVIEPELNNLLMTIETVLEKLARREQSLIARAQLQSGRLTRDNQKITTMDALKMEQLRQKKERLSYAVGRLELQATQKERQLRKSMAGV